MWLDAGVVDTFQITVAGLIVVTIAGELAFAGIVLDDFPDVGILGAIASRVGASDIEVVDAEFQILESFR